MDKKSEKFIGFSPVMRKNFWMYPRIMENYWNQLSGSEQKVLDFILRRTWGWERTSDKISLSQFSSGGGKIGSGTGLSKRQIIISIKKLEEKGFILVKKEKYQTNEYFLVVQEVHQSSEKSILDTGELNALTTGENNTHTIDNDSIDKEIKIIYENFKGRIFPAARMNKESREKIKERLKEFSSEEILQAIENFQFSPYWSDNSNTPKTIDWFFDSDKRIEMFLSLNPLEQPNILYQYEENTEKNDKELPT